MRRRDFIAGIAGAAAWPVVGLSQQSSMPIVGHLGLTGYKGGSKAAPAMLAGLAETGFVVGRNLLMEYRWADTLNQLPSLATELVRLRPDVIYAGPTAGALAAKVATADIPIVFMTGDDPIAVGLVTSLAHPGGNLTGATLLSVEIEQKRFAMLVKSCRRPPLWPC